MKGLKYDDGKPRLDLSQAKQDSRILPCKIGDTVYEIMHPGCRDCAGSDPERYKSCHVRYGEFCGKEEIRPIPFSIGCLDYMGGLMFLTREEAEAKLKEATP